MELAVLVFAVLFVTVPALFFRPSKLGRNVTGWWDDDGYHPPSR